MMSIFCNHDWATKTGMDSGSYCTKCSSVSNKEVDISKSSGLNDGVLKEKIKNVKDNLGNPEKNKNKWNPFSI